MNRTAAMFVTGLSFFALCSSANAKIHTFEIGFQTIHCTGKWAISDAVGFTGPEMKFELRGPQRNAESCRKGYEIWVDGKHYPESMISGFHDGFDGTVVHLNGMHPGAEPAATPSSRDTIEVLQCEGLAPHIADPPQMTPPYSSAGVRGGDEVRFDVNGHPCYAFFVESGT